jgi:hypothetical protein
MKATSDIAETARPRVNINDCFNEETPKMPPNHLYPMFFTVSKQKIKASFI